MSSMKKLVRACTAILFGTVAILSLRPPPSRSGSELSILMEPDGTGAWQELISEFNRSSAGARVRLVEGPAATNSREDLYSISFLSERASYDLVYCDVIWTAKFASAGWLMDLSTVISPDERKDFLEADLAAGTYRGKLYRIPAFTDVGLLYYRKDLISQPPHTFQQLVKQARELQTADRGGFLWQGKQYEGLVAVFLEVLWGYGGDWINPETRQVLINSPEALEALRFLKNTIGTISPPGVTGYLEEDTRILFQSGRAVFLRNWPYVWTLMKRSRAPMVEKTAFTSMVHQPGTPGGATLGGWGFAVSSFSANIERALEFVDFATRPRQLARLQQMIGLIPSRKSLLPAEFLPIVRSVRMRPPIPEYAQASDILQRWVSAALTGRVECERALAQAARETALLLKQ